VCTAEKVSEVMGSEVKVLQILWTW